MIVPIYNGEEHLEKCLNSIINQTFKDFELILIDDGSKDQSLKICLEFERKYNNVKVFIKKTKELPLREILELKNHLENG